MIAAAPQDGDAFAALKHLASAIEDDGTHGPASPCADPECEVCIALDEAFRLIEIIEESRR